jgi:hypothetical protein
MSKSWPFGVGNRVWFGDSGVTVGRGVIFNHPYAPSVTIVTEGSPPATHLKVVARLSFMTILVEAIWVVGFSTIAVIAIILFVATVLHNGHLRPSDAAILPILILPLLALGIGAAGRAWVVGNGDGLFAELRSELTARESLI